MMALDRLTLTFAVVCCTGALAACGSSSGSSAANGGSAGSPDDAGSAGRSGSGAKAKFDSIWRRTSAEVVAISNDGGSFPEEKHFEMPAKIEHPEYETDVEIFEQIEGVTLIVYAHFDESEVYQRLRFPLMAAGNTFSWLGQNGVSGVYDVHDNALRLSMTQQTDMAVVLTTTHYEAYTGSFPPASWPKKVVDVVRSDRGGAP